MTSEYVMSAFVEPMPSILCNLFIIGKFILVLYKEIKEHGTFKVKFFFHNVSYGFSDRRLHIRMAI